MSTTRSKAVYLPSNIDYLATNNGLEGATEALEKLMGSNWVIWSDVFTMMLSPLTSSPGSSCLALDSTWLALSWYRSVNAVFDTHVHDQGTLQIDPRCRLVGQKMNPSRTYTPSVSFQLQKACRSG